MGTIAQGAEKRDVAVKAFATVVAELPETPSAIGALDGLRSMNAVNAVAPGAVLLPDDWDEATRQHFADTTPLRRLGSAEDVAGAVVYLLEADYVTGEVLVVDGGRLLR